MSLFLFFILYGIHKIAFNTTEYHYGDKQHNQHKYSAVEQTAPIDIAGIHTAVSEGFEYRGKRIQFENMFIFFGCSTQRINYRCGIHK